MNCEICGHLPTGLCADESLYKIHYMVGLELRHKQVCRACQVLAMNAAGRQLASIEKNQKEDQS